MTWNLIFSETPGGSVCSTFSSYNLTKPDESSEWDNRFKLCFSAKMQVSAAPEQDLDSRTDYLLLWIGLFWWFHLNWSEC